MKTSLVLIGFSLTVALGAPHTQASLPRNQPPTTPETFLFPDTQQPQTPITTSEQSLFTESEQHQQPPSPTSETSLFPEPLSYQQQPPTSETSLIPEPLSYQQLPPTSEPSLFPNNQQGQLEPHQRPIEPTLPLPKHKQKPPTTTSRVVLPPLPIPNRHEQTPKRTTSQVVSSLDTTNQQEQVETLQASVRNIQLTNTQQSLSRSILGSFTEALGYPLVREREGVVRRERERERQELLREQERLRKIAEKNRNAPHFYPQAGSIREDRLPIVLWHGMGVSCCAKNGL
eukprot:Pgem_evm1s7573